MTVRTPIPLRLDPSSQVRSFWRGVADKLVQRAASSSSSTSTTNVLPPVAVGPLLTGLAPSSALMALFDRCPRLDMTGMHQGIIPRVDSVTAPTLFTSEG